jgi:hypothetical protein
MSKKQIVTIVICIVIFGALGFLGYRTLESHYKTNLDVLEQEKIEWQAKNEELTDKIVSLKKTVSTLTGDANLVEDEDIVSEDESGSNAPGDDLETTDPIEDVERRIAAFFVHLDQQDYIKEYDLDGSSYNEYEEIIQKISEKPPLLGNETESLYNMFVNIAHFYRALGKERIFLVKNVLAHENENIESTMRDFYLWYTYDGKDRKKIKGRPSQQTLYEYAGFFLNTIGGRNYLMRRESNIRILTSYYSVLILDRANDMKQNPNGIDIRPYLRLVISDLSNKSGFTFHYEYMKNLKRLKEKYNID